MPLLDNGCSRRGYLVFLIRGCASAVSRGCHTFNRFAAQAKDREYVGAAMVMAINRGRCVARRLERHSMEAASRVAEFRRCQAGGIFGMPIRFRKDVNMDLDLRALRPLLYRAHSLLTVRSRSIDRSTAHNRPWRRCCTGWLGPRAWRISMVRPPCPAIVVETLTWA